MKNLLLTIVAAAAFTGPAFSAEIMVPGAKLEKLAGDCKFTEGPARDQEGNVYFTDQPNDRILKWDGKELTTWMQPCGRSNGLCFDKDGNLLACADGKNELWRISPDKKVEVLLKDFDGKVLNGPNDIWLRPDGGMYFTDPFYGRDYWDRTERQQDGEHVYFITPDLKKVNRVTTDLEQPNGIIGTPDGKTLYVADIKAKKTYRYAIREDGSLADKTLFCEMESDGMTIDSAGNVYLTNKGVHVFDPSGKHIAHIEVPEPWTGNVCFGGKDRKTLFITASKGLYAMPMTVSGVGSQ